MSRIEFEPGILLENDQTVEAPPGLPRLEYLRDLSKRAAMQQRARAEQLFVKEDGPLAKKAKELTNDTLWARRIAAEEYKANRDIPVMRLRNRHNELGAEAKMIVGEELEDLPLIEEAYELDGHKYRPDLLLRLAQLGHLQAYKDMQHLLKEKLPDMPVDSEWRENVEADIVPAFTQLTDALAASGLRTIAIATKDTYFQKCMAMKEEKGKRLR